MMKMETSNSSDRQLLHAAFIVEDLQHLLVDWWQLLNQYREVTSLKQIKQVSNVKLCVTLEIEHATVCDRLAEFVTRKEKVGSSEVGKEVGDTCQTGSSVVHTPVEQTTHTSGDLAETLKGNADIAELKIKLKCDTLQGNCDIDSVEKLEAVSQCLEVEEASDCSETQFKRGRRTSRQQKDVSNTLHYNAGRKENLSDGSNEILEKTNKEIKATSNKQSKNKTEVQTPKRKNVKRNPREPRSVKSDALPKSEDFVGDNNQVTDETDRATSLQSQTEQQAKVNLAAGYKQYLTHQENNRNIPVYNCPKCKFVSKHVGHFHRHITEIHNSLQNWKCQDCEEEFSIKHEFEVHRNGHTKPFLCELCPTRFSSQRELQLHSSSHAEGIGLLKCNLCEKTFKMKASLVEHMRKHTGQQICCPEKGCQFKTCYASAMNLHKRQQHCSQKRFCCPTCGYLTSDNGSYQKHLKVHSNTRDYKCGICGHRAVTKYAVIKHMKIHTKEKMFSCDQCDFTTSHSSALKLHIMQHQGLKPWHCSACEYKAITKSKIDRHIKLKHRDNPSAVSVNFGDKINIDVTKYRIKDAYEKQNYITEKLIEKQPASVNENSGKSNVTVQVSIPEKEAKSPNVLAEVIERADDVHSTVKLVEGPEEAYMCNLCGFASLSFTDVQIHEITTHAVLAQMISSVEHVEPDKNLVIQEDPAFQGNVSISP